MISKLALFVTVTATLASLASAGIARLSQNRSDLAAVANGNLIFFAGGRFSAGSRVSTRVDIFDTTGQTWTHAELSHARCMLAAASAGNVVAFAGGWDLHETLDIVDFYNVLTRQWSTGKLSAVRHLVLSICSQRPQNRRELAAASLGSKMFFAGGYNGNSWSGTVDVYDTAARTWQEFESLETPRCQLCGVTIGDRVHFASGSFYFESWNTVDVYSAAGAHSTMQLKMARANVGCGALNGRLVFAGGYLVEQKERVVNFVDIYETASGRWSNFSLAAARRDIASARFGDTLVFAGGRDNEAKQAFNTIDMYSSTGKWTTNTLAEARGGAAAASANGLLAIAGGSFFVGGNPRESDLVEIFPR